MRNIVRSRVLLLSAFMLALLAYSQGHAAFQSMDSPRPDVRDMALIPGGVLHMGIDSSEVPALQRVFGVTAPQLFEAELPRHSVMINSFYMDKYLVTNAQFKEFVERNPRWQLQNISKELHNGNYLKHWSDHGYAPDKANHPVVNVSWYAAVAYCQWAGKRLPTEAEFEHAARGGLTARYAWGDEPVDKTRANYSGSGNETTTPVGSYPPNGYGLFDMAGNVWEFLADEWRPYPSTPQKNPVAGGDLFARGPSFLRVKTRRVIRGGSWGGAPINLWVEYRDSHPPEGARDFVGLRCAAPATGSP